MKKTKLLVTVAMLIAINIVLSRLLAINITPTLRITFGFLAVALIGIRFGPIMAGLGAGIADVLGFFIFNSSGGSYFPGFTLTAVLSGVVYGIFLYKKKCNLVPILIAASIVVIFLELGLNTYWLSMLYGKGFLVLLPPRLIKSAIMIPTQTGLIFAIWKVLARAVPDFKVIE